MRRKRIAAIVLSSILLVNSVMPVMAAESNVLFSEEETVVISEDETVDADGMADEDVIWIEEEVDVPEEIDPVTTPIQENVPMLIGQGQTYTLEKDVTVTSVTITGNGKLDLAGYTLTVVGDVVQQGGTVSLNRGTMNVGGDFIQKEGYNSYLQMRYSNDSLNIAGSYRTDSAGSTYSLSSDYLKDGVITIGRDLIVGNGSKTNFYSVGNHKVVFSGSGSHLISFSKANYDSIGSHINNLVVESGKITVNDLFWVKTLESDLDITSVNGGTLYLEELGMNGHQVKINGNVVQINDTINVAGGNLNISGDFTQQGGLVKLNRGTMNVGGDFIQEEGYKSYLQMIYSNDSLNIAGSYRTDSTGSTYSLSSDYLKDGVITIGKDLIVGNGSKTNFYSVGNHKVVFSGSGSHLISFSKANYDSIGSHINNLVVESGKITVNDLFWVKALESDLDITSVNGGTLHLAEFGINGHQVKINGNVIQIKGTINLSGGNLNINGDFTQQGGTVSINKGTMDVGGYYLQAEGYGSLLKMVYTNDRLNVGGSYATYSTSSSSGSLTDGIMTVKGDFTEGAGSAYNFTASKNHLVKLNGDSVQKVNFTNYSSSHFNRLHVSKPIATGYVFIPYPCWEKISGYIYTYKGFDDIPDADGNWKHDNVKYVYEQGIMNGITGTNNFAPDEQLTRAMFATVLYRMAGEPEVSFYNKFPDVISGKYYSKPIIWAYEQGIVNGLGDGNFGVNDSITREQIAKMLYQFGKSQGFDMGLAESLDSFTDTADVSPWATGYVQWAVGAKMISGKPNENGTFRLDPKGNATRAECAKMLAMFMRKYMDI